MRALKSLSLLVLLACGSAALQAQSGSRWAVEGKTSLAWWQVDPHFEHLWATTCPADPSWQPGEGRDPGLYTDYATRPAGILATGRDARIPLFPRYRVRPLCRQALRGEIAIPDTVRWEGVRGTVTLIADSLFTGLEMRDVYARRAVLETGRFPEITFTIDSLVDMHRGDTIRATAVGKLTAHGVTLPARARLVASREGGGLRVQAQFSMPALALVDDLRISKWALGMGVVMRRWETFHMGVDLVIRAAAP